MEKAVKVISSGVVHRHESRGMDAEGRREQRKKEDDACRAGLRNAFLSVDEGSPLAAVGQK